MKNKLPEHIQNKIFQESEDLYNKLDELAREYDHYDFGLPMFDKQKQPIIDLLTERYQQCQQLAEALSDLIEYQNLNRYFRPGLTHDWLCESQAKLKEANEKAAKLLATWNEGKPEKQQNKR